MRLRRGNGGILLAPLRRTGSGLTTISDLLKSVFPNPLFSGGFFLFGWTQSWVQELEEDILLGIFSRCLLSLGPETHDIFVLLIGEI